jgi:FkbH-like protein
MTSLYENLAWLPDAPQDFASQLANASAGAPLRALANYRLDSNQLNRLAKKLASLQNTGTDMSPLAPFSLGIISNATTKLITPALVGTALRSGIALTVVEAEYNQLAQEAFSEDSIFSGHKLDAILVGIDYRALPLASIPGDKVAAEKNIADCIFYIKTIADNIHTKTGAQIILQNIAHPVESFSGSFEGRLPGTLSWLITRINLELDAMVSGDLVILDTAALAANVGLENWHDVTLWNMAKLPFSQNYVPIYSDYVCRIIAARRGKSRRCLILDLDNTLWGGVIGDDGLEGILIGNGDATGEAHLNVQQVALDLRGRGVVLAVSSKNDEAIARKPFQEHPDMLLREEHIAVFQANWSDKASNIRAIAKSLSLGLDSMVFLDDNPAERLQVRTEIPEVAVPELPSDPALYGRTLLAAGYFESIAFSEEDSKRAIFYQQNAQRTALLNQSDMDGYLRSLNMEITFSPFEATGRARIVQLISKSNQFNLTTKRYSELDVKQMEEDNNIFTRQIRLADRFGDNGMISVIICRILPKVWEIDTWLMSCRVLGRCVEESVLQDIIKNASKAGAVKLIGTYVPTPRNAIVKAHYKKLGFTSIACDESGTEKWELDFTGAGRMPVPMTVKCII